MIQKTYDIFEVVCDVCGEATLTAETFDAALSAIKKEGWVTTKEAGEWFHTCPECQ